MMRFRVFAWLAALVVLAGCVESNVEESISRAADGLVVEHNCDPVERGMYGSGKEFPLFPENGSPDQTFVNNTQAEVLIRSSIYTDRPACSYIISQPSQGALLRPTMKIESLEGVEASLSPQEALIFENEVANCEHLGDRAMHLYLSAFINLYSNPAGFVDDGQFTGCTNIIKKNVIGFNLSFGKDQFRVVLIADQLLTLRIN